MQYRAALSGADPGARGARRMGLQAVRRKGLKRTQSLRFEQRAAGVQRGHLGGVHGDAAGFDGRALGVALLPTPARVGVRRVIAAALGQRRKQRTGRDQTVLFPVHIARLQPLTALAPAAPAGLRPLPFPGRIGMRQAQAALQGLG